MSAPTKQGRKECYVVPENTVVTDNAIQVISGSLLHRLATAEAAEEPVIIPLSVDELLRLLQNIDVFAIEPRLLVNCPNATYDTMFMAQARGLDTVEYASLFGHGPVKAERTPVMRIESRPDDNPFGVTKPEEEASDVEERDKAVS